MFLARGLNFFDSRQTDKWPAYNRQCQLKGPFIATQLNSTGRRVELSCVAINGPLETRLFSKLKHVFSSAIYDEKHSLHDGDKHSPTGVSASVPAIVGRQTRAPPRALRSSDAPMLVVPRVHTELAHRAFSVAAPSTWNSLPADIRLCENILTFKRHLKTHLFKLT